ncbi:MAG TPA: ABC transporter permease subunit, partial [Polyangiaceae bacterium]|nr:ABC transporter permease subunit [Polyangiaceae bacterium]
PSASSAAPPPEPPPEAPATFDLSRLVLFVKAAGVTLALSLGGMLLASPLGLLLACARTYGGRVLGGAATAYVEVLRGTPLLLQLYLLYFGLAPWLKLPAAAAAVLALGLNYAAYEAEAYRAGIQAVPEGHTEAGLALGLSRPRVVWSVVLPQATRLALPNVTSDFVSLLKDSSLVSVITVVELTKQMSITAVDVREWARPGLACALLYLAMSYPLARLARRFEKKRHPRATREAA